jgi:hypothetical protein
MDSDIREFANILLSAYDYEYPVKKGLGTARRYLWRGIVNEDGNAPKHLFTIAHDDSREIVEVWRLNQGRLEKAPE